MAGITNRGKARIFEAVFRGTWGGGAIPTNFYIALVTSANTPTADTNLMSDLTQIATGNGYSDGGFQLDRNATDFDVLTEDDTADQGLIQVKDVSWPASGGPIPASGGDARWAVITTDEVTVANREVVGFWDLENGRSVNDGASFVLEDLELDLDEV